MVNNVRLEKEAVSNFRTGNGRHHPLWLASTGERKKWDMSCEEIMTNQMPLLLADCAAAWPKVN